VGCHEGPKPPDWQSDPCSLWGCARHGTAPGSRGSLKAAGRRRCETNTPGGTTASCFALGVPQALDSAAKCIGPAGSECTLVESSSYEMSSPWLNCSVSEWGAALLWVHRRIRCPEAFAELSVTCGGEHSTLA
jgi:hypothetical protein